MQNYDYNQLQKSLRRWNSDNIQQISGKKSLKFWTNHTKSGPWSDSHNYVKFLIMCVASLFVLPCTKQCKVYTEYLSLHSMLRANYHYSRGVNSLTLSLRWSAMGINFDDLGYEISCCGGLLAGFHIFTIIFIPQRIVLCTNQSLSYLKTVS